MPSFSDIYRSIEAMLMERTELPDTPKSKSHNRIPVIFRRLEYVRKFLSTNNKIRDRGWDDLENGFEIISDEVSCGVVDYDPTEKRVPCERCRKPIFDSDCGHRGRFSLLFEGRGPDEIYVPLCDQCAVSVEPELFKLLDISELNYYINFLGRAANEKRNQNHRAASNSPSQRSEGRHERRHGHR